jgi:hypothetical protein
VSDERTLRREKRDYTGRSLPGPGGCRLSEGDQTPEALFELLQGLAENTNSIFCDGLRGPGTENGCLVLRRAGTHRREHSCELPVPAQA